MSTKAPAMRIKGSNKTAKPVAATSTSESLDAQIAAFLQSGGEIQQIDKGVSGQSWTPNRHITIGKK
mgnify:CR=1 FL=1|jgi:hypothetical protein